MQDIKVVAICYTQDKKVKYVSLVKNVSEQEYEKLCQEMLETEIEKERKFDDLVAKVEKLDNYYTRQIARLEKEINTLKGID